MKGDRQRKILVRQYWPDERCYVRFFRLSAKDVARNSRQEVTLHYKLYLTPSSLAMVSRK